MKIKVFVVEDLTILRNHLVKKLRDSDPDIQIVGDAANGVEALEKIRETETCVVFTDIQMPVMDGLALIEKVKQFAPQTIFVIISNHENFEYARQALLLGVKDYVVKPITQEAIAKAVASVKEEISARLENGGRQYLLEALKEYRYILQCYEQFHVLSVQVGNQADTFSSDVHQARLQAICERLRHACGAQADSAWVRNANRNGCTFLAAQKSRGPDLVRRLREEAQAAVQTAGEMPCTICWHFAIPDAVGLPQWTETLRQCVRQTAVFAHSRCGPVQPAENHDQPVTAKAMAQLFGAYEGAALRRHLGEYLSLAEKQCCTEQALHDTLTGAFEILKEKSPRKRDEVIRPKQIADSVLIGCYEYSVLCEVLTVVCEEIRDASRASKQSLQQTCEDLKEYIDEHFCEPITLTALSDQFQLNAAYISRILKNELKITFSEYIAQKRVERAKQLLLENPSLMIREIGEQVGYDDSFYFSKVFKMYTGKTPTEMRRDFGGEE